MTRKKQLVVEGRDDMHCVIELMKKHGVEWPKEMDLAPVRSIDVGSVDTILSEGFLSQELKSTGIERFGVMIDADDQPVPQRYSRLRARCLALFPSMPNYLPAEGLIVKNEFGQHLGVWIMPNNRSAGKLETFLTPMVRKESKDLWDLARQSASQAARKPGAYKDKDREKADLYTWLAWQEPPGQSAGRALTQRLLDPAAESALPFIQWFRSLYEL